MMEINRGQTQRGQVTHAATNSTASIPPHKTAEQEGRQEIENGGNKWSAHLTEKTMVTKGVSELMAL